MKIEWDVPIQMDDGIILRADVYRPIEEGEYPVVLTYGPYAKGLPFQEAYPLQWKLMTEQHPDVEEGSTNKYQTWEAVDPEKWVPHGYVCVRVDSRGAGRSPGYINPFSARETRDYYECIEWAGIQPWSNGKVGLNGISYYAMNQWQVAALQPPHLAAIIPWEGAADWYRDATHHGGIVSTFWSTWYKPQVLSVQYGVGERGKVNPNTGEYVAGPETLSDEQLAQNRTDLDRDILSSPLATDEYNKERAVDWSKVTVPLLSAANWGGIGLHSRGNFEGYKQASSTQKWLEVHGLEHWTHFYTDYGVNIQRSFFDHFLKGEDNGWDETPPVLLQVRGINEFVVREEQEWPIPRTQWKRLYLRLDDSRLDSEPVAESKAEYDAFGDGITFLTEPFVEETEITGPMASKLFVSSSTTDTDVFLTVHVFDPEGNEVLFSGAMDPRTPISQGWLRASHRKLDPQKSTEYRPYHTHDEIQPLTPNEIYELDVEIWPSSIVIPAGYRLGLTVGGCDYKNTDEGTLYHTKYMTGSGAYWHDDERDRPEEIFGGKVTLHAGGGKDAYLLIPVIPKK
ncbi:peptidase S15 [Bacillus canaveralius]|uniref:Peptidase S15 n=2 Tax=Bacillus canaveralius TaxID=1403243 RepID=A0A2N5GGE2_9BACI|nr:peptidase S15 [Bacillus canaveralius]PLR88304.1 peptidase S15 [Bacillus canaveralius]